MPCHSTAVVSLVDRRVPCDVPSVLRATLDGFARTEDIRFTKDGRRIAIAGFARCSVLVLELSPPPALTVTGVLELVHDELREPHGLDWFDDGSLAVANRSGHVQIFRVPAARFGAHQQQADIQDTIKRAGLRRRVRWPGSLAIERQGRNPGLWVCNNYAHCLTYHPLRMRTAGIVAKMGRVALSEDLNVPDGVAISDDGAFMAVSNHETHQVFVYRLTGPGRAMRIGQLNRISYPHGLRFLPGGKGMIIADAGQPYLHVFETASDWAGDHQPDRHVHVLDEETFLRGHHNAREGGIKGLDIDLTRGLVATTCETGVLTFFDLADIRGVSASGTEYQTAIPAKVQVA